MRHLELHILQSVPVACLNRDDFGSPKTALFGNVQRARVSSQCWKRAVRELMQEEAPALSCMNSMVLRKKMPARKRRSWELRSASWIRRRYA